MSESSATSMPLGEPSRRTCGWRAMPVESLFCKHQRWSGVQASSLICEFMDHKRVADGRLRFIFLSASLWARHFEKSEII